MTTETDQLKRLLERRDRVISREPATIEQLFYDRKVFLEALIVALEEVEKIHQLSGHLDYRGLEIHKLSEDLLAKISRSISAKP